MKINIRALPLILFFLILLVFLYLLQLNRDPSSIPSNLINKNIPYFETESLFEQKKFISEEKFTNEIILVNFFATWCKPCRDEHVFLNKFKKKNRIKIIGINYKDDPEKAIMWLKKLGNPYSNIAIDKNGKIAIDWGVYGIPETFIVDSNKIIKFRNVGPINKKLYKKINKLIKNISSDGY